MEIIWVAGGKMKGAKNYVPVGAQYFLKKDLAQTEIDGKCKKHKDYEYKPMKFVYAGEKGSCK